ncbi:hypothetical protein NLJ89_g3146 [Agrocybe chaxingu]|uniref:Multiple myeloma tumor-associated protein 2-like N-terminal domain-containing protein n=1 Tax=Agrocybe chaxingu TaxID=84603 RepID=A0A9W8K658_9AGAR|nr:hypothetical protein NLJ89_g3146 [Agrocybe chaxingu]
MFEPVRGGTRGGQAEFKWSDVSADKDREHYLGHSVNAPTGRWQKNKDIHWYNRDVDQSEAARNEEIQKIKALESEALAAVLGYEPTTGTGSGGSGANAISVASSSNADTNPEEAEARAARKKAKEEKRLRKEEKRARKELKRLSQTGAHGVAQLEDKDLPLRHPSRSRSPRFRSRERRAAHERRPRSRSRSRTPPQERRMSARYERPSDYDMQQREREREMDRRRWDASRQRELPPDRRRY